MSKKKNAPLLLAASLLLLGLNGAAEAKNSSSDKVHASDLSGQTADLAPAARSGYVAIGGQLVPQHRFQDTDKLLAGEGSGFGSGPNAGSANGN